MDRLPDVSFIAFAMLLFARPCKRRIEHRWNESHYHEHKLPQWCISWQYCVPMIALRAKLPPPRVIPPAFAPSGTFQSESVLCGPIILQTGRSVPRAKLDFPNFASGSTEVRATQYRFKRYRVAADSARPLRDYQLMHDLPSFTHDYLLPRDPSYSV